MIPRLELSKAPPEAMKAMMGLEAYVRNCGLEPGLVHLVKTRASQINGCAYCLDMHTRDARALGETEQRLHLLPAWRESPLYTDRERAALAWTEALTLVSETHAPDDALGLVPSGRMESVCVPAESAPLTYTRARAALVA